jgi:hypothetical protein
MLLNHWQHTYRLVTVTLLVDNVVPRVIFCHLWVIYKKRDDVHDVTSNSVGTNVTFSSPSKIPPPFQPSVLIIRILIFYELGTLISQRLTPSLRLKHLCNSSHFIGFEVFTAVVMKSINFWDMTPCACQTYFFDPEDGGDMFLRNVGCNSMDYTASYPSRWYSSTKYIARERSTRMH